MTARHRAPVVVALPLTAALLWPGTALAHSAVIGTDPAEGATLTTAPRTMTIHFNEAIRAEFSYAQLTLDGGRAPAPTTSVTGPDLVVSVPAPLPDGRYTLAYRIASADAHPVSGALHFTVAAGASSPSATPTRTSPAATPASSSPSTPVPGRTSTAPAATTASPSVGTTGATDDGGSFPWLPITLAGLAAAVAGWWAGGRFRNRRR